MKLTPVQRRAERRRRNQSMVDLNLVSLIDVFTILIFFLLANAAEVEVLPSSKSVKLPESVADKAPRQTVVVVVSGTDILVQGYRVASVKDVMSDESELIVPLKAELDRQSARLIGEKSGPAERAVTIIGDKEIPYALLRKVMVTCARANYSDVSFAVTKKKA